MANLCEDGRGSDIVDLLPVCIGISSNPEHRVVRPTAGTKHTRKHRSLSRRWVEPESLAHLHKNSVQLLRIKVNRKDDAIPPSAKADGILAQNA
jgi:hypothetical protein